MLDLERRSEAVGKAAASRGQRASGSSWTENYEDFR
jgi:hypothetical protein